MDICRLLARLGGHVASFELFATDSSSRSRASDRWSLPDPLFRSAYILLQLKSTCRVRNASVCWRRTAVEADWLLVWSLMSASGKTAKDRE